MTNFVLPWYDLHGWPDIQPTDLILKQAVSIWWGGCRQEVSLFLLACWQYSVVLCEVYCGNQLGHITSNSVGFITCVDETLLAVVVLDQLFPAFHWSWFAVNPFLGYQSFFEVSLFTCITVSVLWLCLRLFWDAASRNRKALTMVCACGVPHSSVLHEHFRRRSQPVVICRGCF